MRLFPLTLILSQTVFQRWIFSIAPNVLGETEIGCWSKEKFDKSDAFKAPKRLFSICNEAAITDLQQLHVIKLAWLDPCLCISRDSMLSISSCPSGCER